MSNWNNNEIQFARLICEFVASSDIEWEATAESMNLTLPEINELYNRAEKVWETAKNSQTQE